MSTPSKEGPSAPAKGPRGAMTGEYVSAKASRNVLARPFTTRVKTGSRRPAPADLLEGSRVNDLLGAFTGKGLADIVGVSASQPSRWASGKERPGPESAAILIDLQHILAKARLAFGDSGAVDWLLSPNVRFDGNARPLDVFRSQGAGAVIDALDGEMWNNYA